MIDNDEVPPSPTHHMTTTCQTTYLTYQAHTPTRTFDIILIGSVDTANVKTIGH